MKVGITTDIRHSMFSAGHPNTCFAIAELLKTLGHDVIFIHKEVGRHWWDDVSALKSAAATPPLVLLHDLTPTLDLLVEVAFFVSPMERARLAKQCVWYNRKPGLFNDIELTTYATKRAGRDLEGIHAIWMADIFTFPEDITYMKTLYPSIPVEVVPWLWTPVIVEAHRKEKSSPVWSQVYEATADIKGLSIHIHESNQSNTSSCTLPLVILKHAQAQAQANAKLPLATVFIHNTDGLKDVGFFKENVLNHCALTDISYNMISRQRTIDWVYDPGSVILSHSRFHGLKQANLEAAWVGIPVVHNNELLRDLGHGLESLYYPSNSVTGATNAMESIAAKGSYSIDTDTLSNLRKKILDRFHPLAHTYSWEAAIQRLGAHKASHVVKKSMTFNILFTDMWHEFNPAYNTFILAFRSILNSEVSGYSVETLPSGLVPDITFFGPFGNTWAGLPSKWPKVHYTGENTPPVNHESVKLNLGFQLNESESYLRLPLWMISIDWFGADMDTLQNPRLLSLDSCMNSNISKQRSKFCAFIVSNPNNEVRNRAFKIVNSYKPVDSAGRLYNNMGDQIFAGPGGGGGELKKHAFLKDYRFCFAYENTSSPGYTTEKLLHAKAAGCVPIYWGDPKVEVDFDPAGFINASHCKSAQELVDLVHAIESSPERWTAMASVPALTADAATKAGRTLVEMVNRCLKIAGRQELLDLAMAKPMVMASPKPNTPVEKPTTNVPLFVTGATQRFWPSLLLWLDHLKQHKSAVPELEARVYVGHDVSENSLQKIKSDYAGLASFVRYPIEVPPEFSDFWEPKHYAWKIWIYNTVAHDPSLNGRTILYMDSGSVLIRWPAEWIAHAQTNGVSVLDDKAQLNSRWCHSTFCEALCVSQEEKQANQIAACLIVFVAGHPNATQLFSEAYKWAKIRNVITGEKLVQGPKGSHGHRHDQSILSILTQRMNVPRWPIDKIYCDLSARDTLYSGKFIYVHRGDYKAKRQFMPGIDEAFVVNLDRREDRKKAFLESHPDFKGAVRRLPAYDGLKLQLSPPLAALFRNNDFFWKKAVMGCALSHLKLWLTLATDNVGTESYLIMEDDCRMVPQWHEAWSKAYANLPADWEIVYLGGVLPPNKAGVPMCMEPVADGLARIAPNQFFGQKEPTRAFHFCTYAYVLSKKGAMKLIEACLSQSGYYTSADHMLFGPLDKTNVYVLNPLVAGASQDDDPKYQNADFNNFSRIDSFDSDLWNNDERFSQYNVNECLHESKPVNIMDALADADASQAALITPTGPRFVCLDVSSLHGDGMYGEKWLYDLFQMKFKVEAVSSDNMLDNSRPLIVLFNRTEINTQLSWLNALCAAGRTFKLIHLSDEFCNDPIHMYEWTNITGVIRTYTRADLPKLQKIQVIPLGYHCKSELAPTARVRKYTWSFAANKIVRTYINTKLIKEYNREDDIKPLSSIQPHKVYWFEGWSDPKKLKEDAYLELLNDSIFIPCPVGQNADTYRFYEALEAGCIPIFISTPEVKQWLVQFEDCMPFLCIDNWEGVAKVMKHFINNPTYLNEYRGVIMEGWAKCKAGLKQKICTWLATK